MDLASLGHPFWEIPTWLCHIDLICENSNMALPYWFDMWKFEHGFARLIWYGKSQHGFAILISGWASLRSAILFGKSQHGFAILISGWASLRSAILLFGKSQHEIKKPQRLFLEQPLFFYTHFAPFKPAWWVSSGIKKPPRKIGAASFFFGCLTCIQPKLV